MVLNLIRFERMEAPSETAAAPAETSAACSMTHQQRKQARKEATQRQVEHKRASRELQAARRQALVQEAAGLSASELAAHIEATSERTTDPSFQWPPLSFIHGAHRHADLELTVPVVSACSAYLHNQALTAFSLTLLDSPLVSQLAAVASLDLSQNELYELPGLEHLTGLEELNINRNWFRDLPPALSQLPALSRLNAGRNFLRPNAQFIELLLDPPLAVLAELDLRFNKKLYTQKLADQLRQRLPGVDIQITVTYPAPEGARVGSSAADRDATLLRSQLEPYKTILLRQRLEDTFGLIQAGEQADRAVVRGCGVAAY